MDDTLKIGIDGSQATAGAAVYVGAIKRIEAAIDRLDSRGTPKIERLKALTSAGGFAGLAQAAAEISAIKISPASARNIERLSASLTGFKGIRREALRSLSELFLVLSGIQRVGGNAAALNGIANFRGPSAVAVRNVQAFSAAIEAMRPSPHADQIVRQLNAISAAAGNLKGINSGLRSLAFLQSGAVRTQHALRGLGSQFNLTAAASNIFGASIAAFSIGRLVSGIMDANQGLASFRSTMSAIVDDANDVERALRAVDDISDDLAIDRGVARSGFSSLAASMTAQGHDIDDALSLQRDILTTARALGLERDQVDRILRATQQGYASGSVRSEELNLQLADAGLPAPMAAMTRAIETATGRVIDLRAEMAKGTISADAYALMFRQYAEQFGDAVPRALNTSRAGLQRLSNSFQDFLADVADNGAEAGLATLFNDLSALLRSSEGQELARDLGGAIADGARALGAALHWAVENAELLKSVFTAIIGVQIARWAIGGGVAIADFATKAFNFGKSLAPLATRMLPALLTGLRALPVIGTAITLGGIALGAADAAGAFREFHERNLSLGDSLMGMLEEAGANFAKVGRAIGDWARDSWQHVSNFFSGFRDLAAPLFDWLGERFSDLSRWAGGLLADVSRMSGWDDFAEGAANRGAARRDAREGAARGRENGSMLRGTLGVDDPLAPVSVNPFRAPRGNAGSGGAREQRRLREEQERFVAGLSSAAELIDSYREAQELLGRSTEQLAAAGLTLEQATSLSNTRIAESAGLLSATQVATLALTRARELNAAAVARGLITQERANALDLQAEESMRDTLGLFSERERAINSYRQRLRDLQELQAQSPELSGAIAEAVARETYALHDQLGAVTATTSAMHAYAEALADVAAAESMGADGGFMRRRAGTAALSGVVGDTGNYSAQIEALETLRNQSAITAQQYRESMAAITASTLEWQVAMGEGTYVDQFLAQLTRMTEGARNAQETMGNLMAQASEQLMTGFGDSLARAIVYAEDLQSALYDVVNQALASLISGLIQMGIQMLINQLIGQAAQSAAATAAATAGGTVASAWAPAAAAVSLASFGSNAAPAMLGIGATYAMTSALSMAGGLGMKDGGVVVGPGTGTSDSVPRMLSAGEFVVNSQAAAANMGTLQAINNGVSGGGANGGRGDVTLNEAPVTVIASYDPDAMVGAMGSVQGTRMIMTVLGDNADKIRNLLSR